MRCGGWRMRRLGSIGWGRAGGLQSGFGCLMVYDKRLKISALPYNVVA
jgi:hypothetical protein